MNTEQRYKFLRFTYREISLRFFFFKFNSFNNYKKSYSAPINYEKLIFFAEIPNKLRVLTRYHLVSSYFFQIR